MTKKLIGRGAADKLTLPLLIAAMIFTTAGFLMAFFWAGPVNGAGVNGAELIGGQMVSTKLLLSQKIFYFHMPCAVVSMVLVLVAGFYSIRFLVTRDSEYDTGASVCMKVALIFVLATMATGEMWTRFEWGVWWTWEPRLTTYLVLTIVCIAYFVLRNAVDNPEARGVYCAVIGILCMIDIPITYAVTRIIPSSLHPVVFRAGGMTADMGITVAVCAVGMLLLGIALFRLALRQERIDQRIQAIKDELEG